MIDEGPFGAPIILTPFNYVKGKQYGAELTADYTKDNLNPMPISRSNTPWEKDGRRASSASIPVSSPIRRTTTFISITSRPSRPRRVRRINGAHALRCRLIFGTGLREDEQLTPDARYSQRGACARLRQINTGIVQDFSVFNMSGLSARFDVINLFDVHYESAAAAASASLRRSGGHAAASSWV